MPYTYYAKAQYTGDGVTATFAVPFPYIEKSHVIATVAGVAVPVNWLTDSLVGLGTAPANGAAVEINRVSPSSPLVVWPTPATIRAADLNTSVKQLTYRIDEAIDATVTSVDIASVQALVGEAQDAAAAAEVSAGNLASKRADSLYLICNGQFQWHNPPVAGYAVSIGPSFGVQGPDNWYFGPGYGATQKVFTETDSTGRVWLVDEWTGVVDPVLAPNTIEYPGTLMQDVIEHNGNANPLEAMDCTIRVFFTIKLADWIINGDHTARIVPKMSYSAGLRPWIASWVYQVGEYMGEFPNLYQCLAGGNAGGLNVNGTAAGTAGTVRLQVDSTAGFATGDGGCVVSGVTGTTEANGTWTVNVIDGIHFDLVGSTYANAWAGGGTLSRKPTFTAPGSKSDGHCVWAYAGPMKGQAYDVFEAFRIGLASAAPAATRGTIKASTGTVTTGLQAYLVGESEVKLYADFRLPPIGYTNTTDYAATAYPSRTLVSPPAYVPGNHASPPGEIQFGFAVVDQLLQPTCKIKLTDIWDELLVAPTGFQRRRHRRLDELVRTNVVPAWRGGTNRTSWNKGDLLVGVTDNFFGDSVALPVGADGTTLVADSTQDRGMRWDNAAWTRTTPTPTAPGSTGFAATSVLRRRVVGKTVHIQFQCVVSTAGSGGTTIRVPLPDTSFNDIRQSLSGYLDNGSGKNLSGRIAPNTTSMDIYLNDGSFPAVDTSIITVGGTYERA